MKKTEESKPAPKADDQVKISEHHKADVYVKAAKRYKDIMSKYLKREKAISFRSIIRRSITRHVIGGAHR